jgi:hypothetical protein
MGDYNYGTAINNLIDNYTEMLGILVQARIASDRIDDWQKALDLVINPDQTRLTQLALRYLCGECNEIRLDDERVFAGMKCGHCAYG